MGFRVACTEVASPLCVRRLVSFAEAVRTVRATVEGVTAVRSDPDGIEDAWSRGEVPVLVDPDLDVLHRRSFDALVDGAMAKRNLGTRIDLAPVVVALGPGFTAGVDCHAVVETLAGHDLGRVILDGSAAPDTGRAGPPESYLDPASVVPAVFASAARAGESPWDVILLRAPVSGTFRAARRIGDIVEVGEIVGRVGDADVRARIPGVLRGLIADGVEVHRGLKIGDVDPGGETRRAFTVSEKSNAVAGGVIEAVTRLVRERRASQ